MDRVPRAHHRFLTDVTVGAPLDAVLPRFELHGRGRNGGGGSLSAQLTGEIPQGTPVTLERSLRRGAFRLRGMVVGSDPSMGRSCTASCWMFPYGMAGPANGARTGPAGPPEVRSLEDRSRVRNS